MKTTTVLLLLFFSSFTAFSQENTCMLGFRLGDNGRLWKTKITEEICKGGRLRIVCEVIPNVTYQWKKDGKLIPNENGAMLYAIEEGIYTAEAQSTDCKFITQEIMLKFNDRFDNFGLELGSTYGLFDKDEITLCPKGELFRVNIDNYNNWGEIEYQWQKDGVDIESAISKSFFVDKEGLYSIRAKQGECLSIIKPLKVNIKNDKIITPIRFANGHPIDLKSSDTLNVCENTIINLGGTDFALKYKWYKDDKLINDTETRVIEIKEPGVYFYETTFRNGCDAISEKIVVKFGKTIPKPHIQLTNLSEGCFNELITIYEDSFFYNFSTNTNIAYKMSWYINDKLKDSGWGTFINPFQNNLYKVKVEVGSCTAEETYNYVYTKPRVIKLRNPLIKSGRITMCGGSKAFLDYPITSTGFKIQWYKDDRPIDTKDFSLGVTESGRYYAAYGDLNEICTQYSDTVEVVVLKAPTLVFDKQMLSSCTYRLVTSKKDGITYTWKRDGKLMAGANNYEFFPKESGNYSLVTNNGYCFYESDKKNVELPGKSALAEMNVFCEDDTLKLKAPDDAYVYSWQGPNNFNSTMRNPKVPLNNNSSGLYKLTVSIGECTYKDSVSIKVAEKPKVSIDRADEYCLGRDLILIRNNLNQEFKGSYLWKTPRHKNLDGLAVVLPKTIKSDEGLYSLTATDSESGCSVTTSTEIFFNKDICSFIELEDGSAIVCPNASIDVNFKFSGGFNEDEVFDLYDISVYGEKTLLASGTKGSLKYFAKSGENYILIVESRRKKIFSNIIYSRGISIAPPTIRYEYTQVCQGYSVPLKLDSIYNKYDKIQWLINGIEIPNAYNYKYNASESGKYSVRVERNGCIANSDKEIEVKIGETPKTFISTTYANTSVCNGFSVPLAASAPRLKDLKYQWQLDNIDIPNAVDSFYIAKQDGEYSLKISQGNCSANSSKTRVTIGHLVAPEINSSYKSSDEIDPKEICAGINRTLMSSGYMEYYFEGGNKFVRPIEGVRFQWQRNDVDISMATGSEYYAKEPGVYQLKVFQGDCMAISRPIDLLMGTFSLHSVANQACVGEKINAYAALNDGFTKGIDCKVYKNGEFYKNVKTSEAFEITESGKYDAFLLFESPKSGWVCSYYSDTITVEFKDKIINYDLASSYILTTCLDSIPLAGKTLATSYNPKYQWKLNDISLPNGTTSLLIASQSGNYQLETRSNLGCIYLSNPLKIEFNKLDIGINRPDYICSNNLPYLTPDFNSIIYSGNINKPIEYEWQLDGLKIGSDYSQSTTKSGIYRLLVRQGTCSATASTKIDIIDIPKTLNPNQDSLIICPKAYFTLEAPLGDFTYSWLRDNQFFAGNHAQKIKENHSGIYRVFMEKGECSSVSNTIIVKEKNILPTAIISGNKDIMPGDSVKVKVDFTSLPPWTIKLTNNQEFTATSTPLEFAVKPLQTTVYELASVKNDCGVGTVSGKAEIKILVLGNEEVAGAKIELYPVPTTGICQLKVETTVPEKLGIRLYNVEGKMLLKSEESKSGSVFNEVINLETMPDGVYLLKIKIGDKFVTRKIIKGN